MNAFQYGPLRVEQITLVALAGKAVLGQATVGAGAGPAAAAQVEAQLLAASVAPGARVRSFKTQHMFNHCCLLSWQLHILYAVINTKRGEREERSDGSTFFSAPVEDGHVLQINSQTTPHGRGLAGVSLEATANRTVGVRPEKGKQPVQNVHSSFVESSAVTLWHRPACGPLLQLPSIGTK